MKRGEGWIGEEWRFWPVSRFCDSCGSQKCRQAPSKKVLKLSGFYPIYALVKGNLGIKWTGIQSGAGIHDYEPSTKEVAQIYDVMYLLSFSDPGIWCRLDPTFKVPSCEWSKQPRNDLDKVAD